MSERLEFPMSSVCPNSVLVLRHTTHVEPVIRTQHVSVGRNACLYRKGRALTQISWTYYDQRLISEGVSYIRLYNVRPGFIFGAFLDKEYYDGFILRDHF